MKFAVTFAIAMFFVGTFLSEAGFVPPALQHHVERERIIAPAGNFGKPCVCKSTQACNGGEVNSNVQCHPSYGKVCCVIPEVEYQ